MSDGERPSQTQQQQHNNSTTGDGAVSGGGGGGGGVATATTGARHEARGSISESTSSNSSGGNGYLASTPSSSATSSSSCSASQSANKSVPDTSDTSTATNNTAASPSAIKIDEELNNASGPSDLEGVGRNEEKSNTMNSDSSNDTFHTPSASMQNLSGTGSSRFNGGSTNRKRSDTQDESQQQGQQWQHKDRFLEEDEAVHSDSGATSPTKSLTVTTTKSDHSPSPTRSSESGVGGEEFSAANSGFVADDDEPSNNPNEKPNNKSRQTKKQKSQQHKRQSSAGSQYSLSSNPENSQFKTADAHSSDSDASRNSGSGGGSNSFAFDSGSVHGLGHTPGAGSGSDGGGGKDEDRTSLQSDHSGHSGELLNTSVESVEFGTPGGRSPSIISYSSQAHSPRMSVTETNYSGSKQKAAKKKMWYQQIFSTSYKTRSNDFKKIFKDMPPKERLIVDYSCALQKEILLQGRLYVSQNYVSFYSNIFGWETNISISFKQIESITKEKTALIIPNAIQLSTMTDKYFFSSFVTRDTTYVMLFKLWQSALLEDTISKKEIWRLVHTCYGEELGVTSDDDEPEDLADMFGQTLVPTSTAVTAILTSSTVDADGVTKSISIDPEEPRKESSSPGKLAPEITLNKCDDDHGEVDGDHHHHHHLEHDDDDEEDGDDEKGVRIGSLEWCRLRTGAAISGLICTGEIGGAIAVGLNIGSSIVTSNGVPISSDQLLIKDASMMPIPVPVLPMTEELSDSSDDEKAEAEFSRNELPTIPIVIPSLPLEVIDASERIAPACPVDHTIGKEMMNAVIPCNIDQLFTMLFTNSKFYLDFQTKRKTTDINQSDWQLGEGSQKTRQLTFTVVTGQTIGPRSAHVTETQTLLPASRPGLLYAIQSESVNSGIPYADAFSVNCHYCLTKLSETESNMIVITKIHYKKSTWAKGFIEKNSMNAMVEFFTGLEKALKEECAKMIAGGVTPTSPIIVSNLPGGRRHRRKKCRAPDIPTGSTMTRSTVESNMVHPGTLKRGGTLPSTATETMTDTVMDGVESSMVMKVILVVLGCLLLLNGFLYFKLSSLETAANMSVLYPPTIHLSGEPPQNHQEWLILLQQQETLHRSEVHGWHEVLVSAIKILHQAEKDLENLKGHISTYGKGEIEIVSKPSDILSVVNSFGTLQSSPSPSANVDHPEEETNSDQDAPYAKYSKASNSDSGTDVNGDSSEREKIMT